MRRGRWLALALGAMTAGLLAPSAQAEVQTLSSSGQATWPVVVTSPAEGGFRVSWWEGPFQPRDTFRRWQTVSAAGSGIFGAASQLATYGSPATSAEAPAGDTVVWLAEADSRAYFVLRRPDGSVTAPRPLSAPGRPATEPALAADAAGNAIACWQRRARRFWRAQCAIRRAGSETFGAVATLANGLGREGFSPRPFLGPGGRLLVIYENRKHALAALGSVARGFKAGIPFHKHDPDFRHVPAAVAGDGGATIVATEHERQGVIQTTTVRAYRFSASRRPPSSQLLRKRRFFREIENSGAVLALLTDGSALAAWPVGRRLVAARARPGRRFGRAVPIAPLGPHITGPELAAGPDGTAALTWAHQTRDTARVGFPSQVVQSARYARGAWQRPVPLSAPDEIAMFPGVAVAADGTVAVAWLEGVSANGNIKAVVVAGS